MEGMENRTLRLCVTFLEQIAKLTSSVVLEICAEQCNLNDKVKSDFRLERKAIYLAQIDSDKPHIQK